MLISVLLFILCVFGVIAAIVGTFRTGGLALKAIGKVFDKLKKKLG